MPAMNCAMNNRFAAAARSAAFGAASFSDCAVIILDAIIMASIFVVRLLNVLVNIIVRISLRIENNCIGRSTRRT